MNQDEVVARFYDAVSGDYDLMTGFAARVVQETAALEGLIDRFRITKALDAGCGTGLHSLSLARLGIDVTGIDASGEMIARARLHAREMKLDVRFVQTTFRNVGREIGAHFDAIFCLGNTLPHLLSWQDLEETLFIFRTLLRENGRLFIQFLNFDRIMSKRERIQKISEKDGSLFVRFYDFESDLIQFNILKFWPRGSGFDHDLHSVLLRPIRKEEFLQLLESVGFRDVEIFSSSTLKEFSIETSRDLFITTCC